MVTIENNDITSIAADVIVNAANTNNLHGGGVDYAIAEAAGYLYRKASNESNGVAIGKYLVSSAGELKAKVVIDIPTINLENGEIISLKTLEKVWDEVLSYCMDNGYKSIATPLLGAGVVGYQQNKIIDVLTKVANGYTDLQVTIVVYRK